MFCIFHNKNIRFLKSLKETLSTIYRTPDMAIVPFVFDIFTIQVYLLMITKPEVLCGFYQLLYWVEVLYGVVLCTLLLYSTNSATKGNFVLCTNKNKQINWCFLFFLIFCFCMYSCISIYILKSFSNIYLY